MDQGVSCSFKVDISKKTKEVVRTTAGHTFHFLQLTLSVGRQKFPLTPFASTSFPSQRKTAQITCSVCFFAEDFVTRKGRHMLKRPLVILYN